MTLLASCMPSEAQISRLSPAWPACRSGGHELQPFPCSLPGKDVEAAEASHD